MSLRLHVVALVAIYAVTLLPADAEACSFPPGPEAYYPAPGDTSVPTNGKIWVASLWCDSNSEELLDVQPELSGPEGAVLLEFERKVEYWNQYRPVQPLIPAAEYALSVNVPIDWNDACGASERRLVSSFVVSADEDTDAGEPITIENFSGWGECKGTDSCGFCAKPSHSRGENGFWCPGVPEDTLFYLVHTAKEKPVETPNMDEAEVVDVCGVSHARECPSNWKGYTEYVTTVAVDRAGNRTTPVTVKITSPRCADSPYGPGGCSSSGGPATGASALLLLGLLVARRRQRAAR
jgi:uncharacterized protein (TIGR03382 family)